MAIPILSLLFIAVDNFMSTTTAFKNDEQTEMVALASIKEFRQSTPSERIQRASNKATSMSNITYFPSGQNDIKADGVYSKAYGLLVFGHITNKNEFKEGPKVDAYNEPIFDSWGKPYYNAIKLQIMTNEGKSLVSYLSRLFGVNKMSVKTEVISYFDSTASEYKILK